MTTKATTENLVINTTTMASEKEKKIVISLYLATHASDIDHDLFYKTIEDLNGDFEKDIFFVPRLESLNNRAGWCCSLTIHTIRYWG